LAAQKAQSARSIARRRRSPSKDKAMLLINTIAAARRWMRYRRSLRALSLLDERTLRDIGLNRTAITAAAWSASR
jgi:uncharacterized protein YjiS (DUF1127 family)